MRPGCRQIVVDGHSVLFRSGPPSPEKAPGRRSRRELVALLQQAQDHAGIRVAVVFDGTQGGRDVEVDTAVEVRYAGRHQTADALIERAVAGCRHPEAVTVVTDDFGETQTLQALGADVISVSHFLELVHATCPDWVWERWQDRAL